MVKSWKKCKMKAIIYNQYGPAQVLQVAEIPKPGILNNQVLVKVEAAGLNPKDSRIRNGEAKLLIGNRFPKTGFIFQVQLLRLGGT
jgi:NADPH:quinone reductase-like Zn-dependent oxidoreductase